MKTISPILIAIALLFLLSACQQQKTHDMPEITLNWAKDTTYIDSIHWYYISTEPVHLFNKTPINFFKHNFYNREFSLEIIINKDKIQYFTNRIPYKLYYFFDFTCNEGEKNSSTGKMIIHYDKEKKTYYFADLSCMWLTYDTCDYIGNLYVVNDTGIIDFGTFGFMREELVFMETFNGGDYLKKDNIVTKKLIHYFGEFRRNYCDGDFKTEEEKDFQLPLYQE